VHFTDALSAVSPAQKPTVVTSSCGSWQAGRIPTDKSHFQLVNFRSEGASTFFQTATSVAVLGDGIGLVTVEEFPLLATLWPSLLQS
jgi:hypothetical protein